MKYFLFLLLIININYLFAQKAPKENLGGMKSNTLYVSGTIEGELWFFYERIFKKRHAIEIGYGKKWGSSIENRLSNKTDQAQFYGGNIFMGSYKRYFNFHQSKHPFYISALFFFKNYNFPPLSIVHVNGGESSDGRTCQIRSSHKDAYGLKFLFGRKFNFKIINKLTFVVDIYSGLGLRKKFFNDTVYAYGSTYADEVCTCTTYPLPVSDNSSSTTPSLHLGAKIGFSF